MGRQWCRCARINKFCVVKDFILSLKRYWMRRGSVVEKKICNVLILTLLSPNHLYNNHILKELDSYLSFIQHKKIVNKAPFLYCWFPARLLRNDSVLEVSHYYLITALLCSSTLPHSLLTILLQSHVCLRSVLLLSYHSLTLLFHTSLCQSWAIILKQYY